MRNTQKRKDYYLFIFLFILIFLPNTIFFSYTNMLEFRLFANNLVLILLVLSLWNWNVISKAIAILFLLVFTVNNGLTFMSFFLYKESFNVTLAYNFMATNRGEALEALMTFKTVALGMLVYFGLLFFCINRVAKKKTKAKYLIPAAIVLLIYPIGVKSYKLYAADKDLIGKSVGSRAIYNILGNTPIYNYAEFYEANRFVNELAEVKKEKMQYPDFSLADHDIETIVVVVGESARKDVLSLYGCEQNTTPLLEKRLANLFIYEQAVAASPFTNTALTFMLSKLIPVDKNEFQIKNLNDNIVALGNATQKWETYWLSNHREMGVYENLYSIITKDAKHQKYVGLEGGYDQEILPFLDEVLQDDKLHRLIFVHLQGSHMVVSERYPQEFEVFTFDQRKLVNAYFNSVLYTDYILDQIIQRVENQKSVVLYVSDHGQMFRKEKYIHGYTKKGLDVPFVIWHSNLVDDQFKKVGRDQMPISTTNVYSIVSDLMGVQGLERKDLNTSLKVLSPSFEVVEYREVEQD